MKEANVREVIQRLRQEYPNSKTSLDFNNPFQLLVGTILSAQTTDKAVNKATPDLFKAFPDVFSLSRASKEEVVPYIKSIGLYNNKAKNLVAMAKMIVSEYGGEVPSTMKELTSLPGVGRKTANVVMGNAFGIPDSGITVDTHMIRITNLLGWAKGKNPVKIEKELMKIIPVEDWVDITHLIIDHGRAVCKANRPLCGKCVLADLCPSSLE